MAISPQMRQELSSRARDKNRRRNEFSSSAPSVWQPRQVLHPETGICFTDVSAWAFIADCLDGGCDVEVVEMSNPQGATGYVIRTAGFRGEPDIYIKLTLASDKIHGRSFHYTTVSGSL